MSEIKVNLVTPRSGTTVTLGEAGDTIALGACASQTGFGRTGTVDWCTTAKTAGFTAVTGKGYFVNTCGGAITVILPCSPSAGDIVSLADYKNTWATACKEVTLCRNSSLINGGAFNPTLNTEGQSITLVYVDGTRGWKNTMDSTSDVTGQPNYVTATGGNATITCGDYKTHIFTATGPLNVTSAGTACGSNVAEYFVVGGGAGGGAATTPGAGAGGSGAGGFRMFTAAPGSNSPLNAPAGIAVPVQDYTITVGGGGTAAAAPQPGYVVGGQGNNSVFSTITSAGGGGGSGGSPSSVAAAGGSGGGGGYCAAPAAGGAGNSPPVSPPQGQPGGTGPGAGCTPFAGSGGGGAATAGVGWPGYSVGGAGGSGSYLADPFIGPTAPSYGTPGPTGSTRYFAGGGGGSGGALAYASPNTGGAGGAGGGGAGGSRPNAVSPAGPPAVEAQGCAGGINTGGGAGGNMGATCVSSLTGGSGIVMVRYKYQN